jgi:hypothetical protein
MAGETETPSHTVDFIPAYPGIPSYQDREVFLGNPMIDNLVKIVIELGAETWTTRRRLRIVEQLLDKGGVVTRESIETHVVPADEQALLEQERAAFVRRIYGVLARDTGKHAAE